MPWDTSNIPNHLIPRNQSAWLSQERVDRTSDIARSRYSTRFPGGIHQAPSLYRSATHICDGMALIMDSSDLKNSNSFPNGDQLSVQNLDECGRPEVGYTRDDRFNQQQSPCK